MSWDRFRQQYEAQGRAKADGYSADHFAGMSDLEQAEARTLLLERALAGDTTDLSGLRHIGNAETISALAAFDHAADRFGCHYDIGRCEVLYDLTGNSAHLETLLRYLDGPPQAVQETAANAIAWHVLPPEAEPYIAARIADGRHDAIILPMLQTWIGIQQRAVCDSASFQRHLPLIRRVKDARPGKRQALLDELAPGLARCPPS